MSQGKDEKLKESIKSICDYYNMAETAMKEFEVTPTGPNANENSIGLGGLFIPSLNKLRYAGQHLTSALIDNCVLF